MKKALLASMSILALFFAVACQGPAGPAGPAGTSVQGVPGPTIYLSDSSGNRYYSGGIVDLGMLYRSSGIPTPVSYALWNNTGGSLTIKSMAVVGGEYDGELTVGGPESFAVWNGTSETLPEIVVPTPLPVGVLPNNGSSSFSLQLNAPNGGGNRFGVFRKQYSIAMTGSSAYDFTFEVYGVISC